MTWTAAPRAAEWNDRADLAPAAPSSAELSRLIRRGFALKKYRPPPLPDVARRLLRMARSDRVQFDEVAALIEQDVSIAAEVLRLVNSPLYSRGVEITSLEQALGRLGLSGLRELASQVAVEMSIFASPAYGEAMERIRRHGTVTAHLTRAVQRASGHRDEGVFTAGLFHDAGLAACVLLVGDVYGDAPPPIDEVWPELLRIHTQVGRHLARSWELPDGLARVLLRHHDPEDATSAVVCVADYLAERVGAGVEAAPRELAEPAAACALLGLDAAALDPLLEAGHEIVARLDA